MAFIGTLRSKMGTWVVVFVFVAIAAFILGDLLGNNSMLLNDDSVGEIAGNTISAEEYQQAIRERENNYILNMGREPGERERPTLQIQAWEMLIVRNAIETQYEKVGVMVTDEELVDMISGKNIDPNIKQSFTNPETGEFDRAQLASYINSIKEEPTDPQLYQFWQQQRMQWEVFQKDLKPGRARLKYENLIIKSTYVTKAEAERDYHLQNDVAEVKYLYVPYFAISDTAVNVTDADYQSYYNKNKEKYKTERTRDLKYVRFEVIPSPADSAAIRESMSPWVDDFKNAESDSTFAIINSDNKENAFVKYNLSNLPAFVTPETMQVGEVIGPFLDGTTYKLMKVSGVSKDTTYTARASHILIRCDDESDASKKAAKDKAREILADIKGGASFAQKAQEFGTDGTASQGGDLGWFTSGTMVKPFQDAVFSASKPGLLNDVVETQFGYHIIEVTNVKDNSAFTLAVVETEITPSDASINEALRKAEIFAADLSGVEAFETKADKEGYPVFDASDLGPGDRRITNLGEARQITQWLYRDAEEGDVSEVFDLQTEYVVAVMTGEMDKGYKPLADVKEDIATAVTNEVKSKVIIDKLNGLSGTLDEMASGFGKDANVYTNSSLKLNSNTLSSVGLDPVVVGIAFSLAEGTKSKPYASENGVVILETQTRTVAPELGDYSIYRNQLEQSARSRNTYNIAEAIKLKANIVDERYKFF